jgi:hypothetical protein
MPVTRLVVPCWCRIMVCVDNHEVKLLNSKFDDVVYIDFIRKELIEYDYNTVLFNVHLLVKSEFLYSRKIKRKTFVYLTPKGRDIAKYLNRVVFEVKLSEVKKE